jgi:rhodanese-related sulfurtransferase
MRMDGSMACISPQELYGQIGTGAAPVVIDVRRDQAFDEDNRLIVGALRHRSGEVESWLRDLPSVRSVVVYCVHGHEVSQGVCRTLRRAGVVASYLEGGIAAWKENGLPVRRKARATPEQKWVTREHPKIDRIACPWLVSRFINPLAEFLYVPPGEVLAVAEAEQATPYDIKNVEFGHQGDRCSFDAIVSAYDIRDAALDHLATIVRGADTSRADLSPVCDGLLAISYGLSASFPDDHEMLRHGLVMYDALYTWCRGQVARQQVRASA